ncbi:MAG TPA: choice-of-anchor D domain-containing protein, partial [Terriglobales bacterium]
MKDRKSHFAIAVDALFLFLLLSVLLGCQGLVAGPHNSSSSSGPSNLSIESANLSWGSVVMGSNQTLTDTVTNAGSSSVTISNVVVTGSDFQIVSPSFPMTLAGGQSTTVTVACNPASTGATTATVAITSNASNVTLTINLSATGVDGGRLAVTPSSFGFGNVNVGANQTLSGTLTNAGSSSLSVTQASASAGFTLSGITLPLALASGQSIPFSVVFKPTQSGAATGTLSLAGTVSLATGSSRSANTRFRVRAHDTTPLSMSVPLSGTGMAVGQFSAAPGNLSFGSVQTGKTASLTETLSNSTGSSVTVSNVAATGSGFSVGGITLPATIAAGASASFSVTYAPQATGSSAGALAITSNASNSSLSFTLAGTGTATPTGTLSAQSASLSFGSVQTGTTQSLTEVLTNSGSASVTISSATITGTGYTLSGLTTPLAVAAGSSASFTVKFAPAAAGTPTGSVTITSNASNASLSIPVSGTAVAAGALTATPSSVSFGTVQTGSSTQNSVTVTNS